MADEAAPELKAGWNVKIGGVFYRILKKRMWRTGAGAPPGGHTYNINAGAILRVEYVNTESTNTNPGTGTVMRRGYAGDLTGSEKILRQYKFAAFGTASMVQVLWKREPYPRDARVDYNNTNAPAQTPLVLQRFSYDPSMLFTFIIDLSGLVAGTQTIFLEMIEYEMEQVQLQRGETFREIFASGFLSEPLTA
jgi:hypothetical protein